jgi:type VI secretion system protein ImpA
MQMSTELLAPIAGESPAGAYLRYDPLYDQIKEARREDDDLPQGDWQVQRKQADWPLVVRLTTDALTKRTKDLQLAAWLTEALLRRDGIGGLRAGLELVRALLEQYWEHVHPEIDEGDLEMRAAPIEWIGGRLDQGIRLAPLNADRHSLVDYRAARSVPTREEAEQDSDRQEQRDRAIAEGRITPEDFETAFLATPKEWYRALVSDIDGALAATDELDGFCNERFGADAPGFHTLRAVLQEVRLVAVQLFARKLELEPDAGVPAEVGVSLTEAVAEGAASAPDAWSAGPAAAAAAPLAVAAAPRNREEAAAWIAAAAVVMRRERPTDPASYLTLRGLRWGELRGGGSVDPKLLSAPRTEVRTRLRELLLDARWGELLDAAEEVMATPQGRGWLDLQRYALSACDGLGGEYDAVRAAIRGALRSLLTDVPELPSLTLMDDSPTANAETLGWLRGEGLLDADAAEPVTSAEPRRRAAVRDVWDIARGRAAAGDARGAMELLMREAMQEKSARARFLRRAQAAEIMIEAGLDAVALPMLREMLAQVDAHQLDDWEAGETVAHPMGLLYRCAIRLDSSDVNTQELYERVCRLDPVAAIRLNDDANGADEGS